MLFIHKHCEINVVRQRFVLEKLAQFTRTIMLKTRMVFVFQILTQKTLL